MRERKGKQWPRENREGEEELNAKIGEWKGITHYEEGREWIVSEIMLNDNNAMLIQK